MSSTTKKFLHVCLSEAWGGLEMAVVKWNDILYEYGHENYNVATPDSPLAKALDKTRHNHLSWNSDTYFSPGFSLKLRRFVKKHKIDVVTLQSLRDIWLVSPALWGLDNVQFVGFTQMLLGLKKTDPLHHLMYKRLNALCVLTDFQQKALQSYLPVDEKRYKVVPNFVDTKKFRPQNRSESFRQKIGFKPNDFVIGLVGRLDPQKGQLELVRAFSEVRKKFLNTKLFLVGDATEGEEGNGYKQAVIQEIQKLNLGEHVVVSGFRDDIDMIMPNLDLFVLASWAETFGFVVIEAMASGVPVLGTEAGGVPEILGYGQYGRLCEPQNSQSISEKIIELLENPNSMSELSQQGRRHVEKKYDRHQVYKNLLTILES